MAKAKTTKRALLASTLSILLCVAMLVGSTYAWFTDSVTSGKNKIVAGNLDVELYVVDGEDETPVDETTNLFMEDALWEPGHVEVVNLKIANLGTLALKYSLGINIAGEQGGTNMAGDPFKLSDYIMFALIEGNNTYETREDAIAAAEKNAVKLSELAVDENGVLYPEKKATKENPSFRYVTLVVYMPTPVGNEANYKTGTDAPTIDLGITLLATQTPYESDSFGDDYDADAKYPVTTTEALLEALDQAGPGDEILVSQGTYELPAEYTIAEGVTITGAPGTVLEVSGGKKDITEPNSETGLTQGLLLNNDNITISGVTITGDVSNATGNKYTGYNALVRITGNNVTLDNVTLESKTNDSPIVIASTKSDDNTITIKNCNIKAAFKAIHLVDGTKGTINIDHCDIDAMYPFNVNTGSSHQIKVSNSKLKGWISYGTSTIKVEFDNCEFGVGHGYGYVVAYADTDFVNCTFNPNTHVYTKAGHSKTMTFTDCNKAGTKLTAENIKDQFDANDSDSIAKNTTTWTVVVDGVAVK